MMGIAARRGWKDELQPRQTTRRLDDASVWFGSSGLSEGDATHWFAVHSPVPS